MPEDFLPPGGYRVGHPVWHPWLAPDERSWPAAALRRNHSEHSWLERL